MSSNKTAIITTVSNKELFNKTLVFFPEGIDLYAIDGAKGLFGVESFKFMFEKLKSKRIKWLIMADEDIVFVNPSGVYDLIKKMEVEQIDVCGIRDGGVLSWRGKNPYLLNPFFCILNLEKILSIYSEEEFLMNQYIGEDEFDDDLSDLTYAYDKVSLFEEYYCFFLWLKRKKVKFYFLHAVGDTFENDLETTTVFGIENQVLLYHTWYARTYGKNEYHTNRINKVIAKVGIPDDTSRNIIWLTYYSFNFKKKLIKLRNKTFRFFK